MRLGRPFLLSLAAVAGRKGASAPATVDERKLLAPLTRGLQHGIVVGEGGADRRVRQHDRRWTCRAYFTSIYLPRQQERELGGTKHCSCRSAENEFADLGVAIRSHDEHVGSERSGAFQENCSCIASVALLEHDRNAVPGKMPRDIRTGICPQ